MSGALSDSGRTDGADDRMRYKLVVFDFDGTLADTFPWFLNAMGEAAQRFGLRQVDPGDIPLLRSYTSRQIMNHLGLPFWKVPMLAKHMREMMAREAGSLRLFPGVEELLRKLYEAGVTISIVSSNTEQNIRAILGEQNSAMVRSFECGASLFGKRSKFRAVLKRTGFARPETLCVGDETRDVEAAQAEGIAFGGVSWGFATVAALRARGARYIFGSPEEIFDVVMAEPMRGMEAAS